MRADHTTRLFPWLPIPSQWAGRVLKFTSILFHDIFIKLPSLNCISGLHGFFLCLHTIVTRTSYMMLSVGYFKLQHFNFFSGGSLFVHPIIDCFSRFLPHISTKEFSLSLTLHLRESWFCHFIREFRRFSENLQKAKLFIVWFHWHLVDHVSRPNALTERGWFAIHSCTWNRGPTSPSMCVLKPEISCQGDVSSSYGTSMHRVWEGERRRGANCWMGETWELGIREMQ